MSHRKSLLKSALLVILVACSALLFYDPLHRRWEAGRQAARRREDEARRLSKDNPPRPESFFPTRAVARQPPITGLHVALNSKETGLDGEELVLAVVIAGQARAYPINMMTGPQREIFNDTLGGRPIAATW